MIRTLLIDNYDSFTFNLYQYLAEVNGCPPVVVPNDWATFDISVLDEFDNVVISPGPGAPGNYRDFGICTSVIQQSNIPLLGICLGHQGLAAAYGGQVVHAPEPVHGRPSLIRHDGEGLFRGIPSPFSVIRYHSFVVEKLPDELEATAWVGSHPDESIVMALQHRRRPQWGVQFHPESIGTDYSFELLRNFAQLTKEFWKEQDPAKSFDAIATGQVEIELPELEAARVKVHVEEISLSAGTHGTSARCTGCTTVSGAASSSGFGASTTTICTDEQLFATLYADESYAVWLDGNQRGRATSRFSIMGSPTGPLSRIAAGNVAERTITITESDGVVQTISGEFFDWFESENAKFQSPKVDTSALQKLPFEFALGWVGYLGYELKAEVGSPNKHRAQTPDAMMLFLDRAIVIDHATDSVYLLYLTSSDSDAVENKDWASKTKQRIKTCANLSLSPQVPRVGELNARHSHADYLRLTRASKSKVIDGESYEVCLTNMLSGRYSGRPLETYLQLRRENPAPFGAYLHTPFVQVLSTSPERFLRISASGEVKTSPIKGTRPRGQTSSEDETIRTELQNCEKDRAENLMIVDLARHDLARTAEIGSVRVQRLFEVETYASVHQLVSTVCADLSSVASPVSCVKAAFPPGSMTGAPKLRTMEILDELEAGPRGIYSGAIGYFSPNGAVDLSVVIRTLVLVDGNLHYGVGGAITYLSDEEAEYVETVVKSEPLLRLCGGAVFPEGTNSTADRVTARNDSLEAAE